LSAIAATAPLVGMLATVIGIASWRRLMLMVAQTMDCECAGGLAEAFVPTALGLIFAIPALWSRHYLCGKLEVLDTEMRAATLELVNALSLLGHRIRE
jgi:biopolymer transport protein ExbB